MLDLDLVGQRPSDTSVTSNTEQPCHWSGSPLTTTIAVCRLQRICAQLVISCCFSVNDTSHSLSNNMKRVVTPSHSPSLCLRPSRQSFVYWLLRHKHCTVHTFIRSYIHTFTYSHFHTFTHCTENWGMVFLGTRRDCVCFAAASRYLCFPNRVAAASSSPERCQHNKWLVLHLYAQPAKATSESALDMFESATLTG